jgi:hypothetical protein
LLSAVCVSLTALSGCGETAIFGATPATNAAECEVQYKEALGRGKKAYIPVPTTAAGMLGASLGKGLARGNIEAAYNQCLARVGADKPVVAVRSADTAGAYEYSELPRKTASQAAPRAFCPTDAPVLYGGTQYCLKR